MKKTPQLISLRLITQISIVITVFTLAYLHQTGGIEKAASIDAYCPFGAVESLFTLIFKGEFLKRIYTSAFILMAIFFVATFFLGRIFCGYFCPLGALQEWLRSLGKKIGLKEAWEIPPSIDKYLRFVKYVIFILIVYYSYYLGDLVFRVYDPYTALMHFGQEFEEKLVGYLILFIILIISLFTKNLWCRYLCPLGAFFGLQKKLSLNSIKRDKNTCIDCGVCDQNCPANLAIKTSDQLKDADCVSCGKCINKCPKQSLSYQIFNKVISNRTHAILVIILVILPLVIAPYTPFWQTKPESNIINVRGEINTADIRGSNTLDYVLKTTEVPFSYFQTKFKLPSNIDKATKLKEIGIKYNINDSYGNPIDTQAFRDAIDEYLSMNQSSQIDCPFGREDCEFPGDCINYTDKNGDNLCDYSQ